MKIFGWMQNKLNGRHGTKSNSTSVHDRRRRQEPCKEEFSDRPHGLLAIGTFGNDDCIKEISKHNNDLQEIPSSAQHHEQQLTPEEVGKLHKELNLILIKQGGSTHETESDTANISLDYKFLHSQPSAEDDRTKQDVCADVQSYNKDCSFRGGNGAILRRGKDISPDNASGSAINKKSLTFLLKKMFVCRSGFSTPTPSLRDQVTESGMEKVLRAILNKKIHPQNPSPIMSTKKYLGNKHKPSGSANEDETNEQNTENGSKWVKTDSEYIVLEI